MSLPPELVFEIVKYCDLLTLAKLYLAGQQQIVLCRVSKLDPNAVFQKELTVIADEDEALSVLRLLKCCFDIDTKIYVENTYLLCRLFAANNQQKLLQEFLLDFEPLADHKVGMLFEAIVNGHTSLVQWLEQKYPDFKPAVATIHAAVNFAVQRSHQHIPMWALTHYQQKGVTLDLSRYYAQWWPHAIRARLYDLLRFIIKEGYADTRHSMNYYTAMGGYERTKESAPEMLDFLVEQFGTEFINSIDEADLSAYALKPDVQQALEKHFSADLLRKAKRLKLRLDSDWLW